MNRRIMRILCGVLACIMVLSAPLAAYAAPDTGNTAQLAPSNNTVSTTASTGVVVDAISVQYAILHEDYDYLIRTFFSVYENYFRSQALNPDFKFFNAEKYMALYPDVAAATGNNKQLALEHYLRNGIYEGRKSGGQYDLVDYIKKNPRVLLSMEFTMGLKDPGAFFNWIAGNISSSQTGTTSGGGGGGGKSPSPSPTPTPVNPKTLTMIYYYSGDNLETDNGQMTDTLIELLLGTYQTKNINYVICLGGADKWHSAYLGGLLDAAPSDTANKTGWFYVDVDGINAAMKQLENKGWNLSEIYKKYKERDEDFDRLVKDIDATLFTKDVLPQISGTTVVSDSLTCQVKTLDKTLTLVDEQFSADEYALIFNDHGNGPLGTMMSVSRKPDGVSDGISIKELADQLETHGYTGDKRLDVLLFDCCLMGNFEIAQKLGKYYEYMCASETEQTGSTDYYRLIKKAYENLENDDLALQMAYEIFDSRYDWGCMMLKPQTQAVIKAEDDAKTAKAIDSLAGQLKTQAEKDDENKAEVFNAMKKAMIYSFQLSSDNRTNSGMSLYDATDYLVMLKKAFNEQSNFDYDNLINATVDTIHNMVECNFVNRNFIHIYNTREGGTIEEGRYIRENYISNDFSGVTIYLPSYDMIGAPKNPSDDDTTITNRAETISEYKNTYSAAGLGTFAELIGMYAAHFNTKAEYERLRTLASEMIVPTVASGGGVKKTKYDDITNIVWDDDKKSFRVTVNPYSATTPTSASSSGDAVIDLFDTVNEFKLYLTKKLSFAKNDLSPSVTTDTVIGVYSIPMYDVDGNKDGVSIYAITTEALARINMSYMNGVYTDEGWIVDKDYVDTILPVSLNYNIVTDAEKRKMILASSGVFTEIDTLKAAVEAETDEEERKKKQATLDNALNSLSDSLVVYDGYGNDSGNQTSRMKLVFALDATTGDYEYKYGCVAAADSYTVKSDVTDVRMAHTKITQDDAGNMKFETIEYVPGEYAAETELYSTAFQKQWYSVTGSNKLTIKTCNVNSFSQSTENSGQNFGYNVSAVLIDGKETDLNDEQKSLSGTNDTGTPIKKEKKDVSISSDEQEPEKSSELGTETTEKEQSKTEEKVLNMEETSKTPEEQVPEQAEGQPEE